MTFAFAFVIFAIFILIVISAFFSGSETALTAYSRARMHALERDGNEQAAAVGRLAKSPERLIGTILLGNNLVNILASALATSLFLSIFGQVGVAYATIAMTALVVIFAEVLPKTYALRNSDRVALFVAPLIKPVYVVFSPVTDAVHYIVTKILDRTPDLPLDGLDGVTAHQELKGAIDLHHRKGSVVKHDRDMLGGVLDLPDLEVVDIMVHRTSMATVNADDPPEKVVDEVLNSPFTRLPAWRGEPENIVGIIHAKDLLRSLGKVKWNIKNLDVMGMAAEPWYVPDTTSLQEQLNVFLKRKSHFALVVDEYGEVQGLVTLEDIIEEIVGQIVDEHDIPDVGIRPQPDGTVNVDGSVPVRDLNRFMDWQLPDEEATTIAGFVIHEAQTIPEPGQVFNFYGFRFEVLRKQKNKITALRILPTGGAN